MAPPIEPPEEGREAAISVRGVSKTYRVPHHRPTTLKERLLRPRSGPDRVIEALRDASFDVRRGEFFGVLGLNGSGKSTLLKVLAGILKPDAGDVRIEGRVSPLIELGVGFHPELVARDNVVLNGAMLGVGRAEMLARYPAIMEFAELEEFEDLPVKNYSSGMLVRLGFATAIQVDADVLLLDEVLAVGDLRFQEKCFEVFRRLHREGTTIVLVSHALGPIKTFCERALLLERGAVVEIGDAEEVVNDYQDAAAEDVVAQIADAPEKRWGDGAAEITEVWFEGANGERTNRLRHGEEMTIKVRARFASRMEEAYIGLTVRDQANQTLFNVAELSDDPGAHEPGDVVVFGVTLDNWFSPGIYLVWPAVAHVSDVERFADLRPDFATFIVDGDETSPAPLSPRHRRWVERS